MVHETALMKHWMHELKGGVQLTQALSPVYICIAMQLSMSFSISFQLGSEQCGKWEQRRVGSD